MPPQREPDLGPVMFAPEVFGVGVCHRVKQLASAVVDREVVEELTEHEVTVISQPRLMLLSVRKEPLLDTAIVEMQLVVNQVTWSRIGGKEVIAVIEIHPFEVRPTHQPHSLPKW